MLNIDVAVNTFWQFARCWKTCENAKLDLSCQNGFLELNFSTNLGHPDLTHFPPPAPQPQPPTPPLHSCKTKNPSQIRREERRRKNRINKTETESETVEVETENSVENTIPVNNIQTTNKAQEMSEETYQLCKQFKCEKCDFTTKGLDNLDVHKIQQYIELSTSYFTVNSDNSLSRPPLKKQDFRGYAHPPNEPSFFKLFVKRCWLLLNSNKIFIICKDCCK